MYSQFFGNYLLNEKLVTSEELLFALEQLKSKQAKLGALAVHFGYMTPKQVEEVHILQTHQDKMFGEIALEKTYITREQIDELISFQKPTYILLGEVLVEEEMVTQEEFDGALEKYKNIYAITDSDLNNNTVGLDNYQSILGKFFSEIDEISNPFFIQYTGLLFTNIIRFIGKDFTPQEPIKYNIYHSQYNIKQHIIGSKQALTAIDATKETLIQFACKYSGLELQELDEYVKASVEDFLNLHNGLFAVNLSNEQSIELTLEPPIFHTHTEYSYNKSIYCIPIQFAFGVVNFLFADLTE